MSPTSATVSQRQYFGGFDAHAHEHVQVLVGLSGHLEIEVDGRAAFVDATCALIVPAGSSHAYEAAAPARVLVLEYPPRQWLECCRQFVAPVHWRAAPQTYNPRRRHSTLGYVSPIEFDKAQVT